MSGLRRRRAVRLPVGGADAWGGRARRRWGATAPSAASSRSRRCAGGGARGGLFVARAVGAGGGAWVVPAKRFYQSCGRQSPVAWPHAQPAPGSGAQSALWGPQRATPVHRRAGSLYSASSCGLPGVWLDADSRGAGSCCAKCGSGGCQGSHLRALTYRLICY